MAEFASRGVGTAGLTTGIIGSALGAANSGLLGNLFGGGWNNNGRMMYSPEDMPVNRYDQGLQAKISELETEVKLRDANFYALGEMGKLRDYMERRFDRVEHEICDQKTYNATNTATLGCMQNQIAQLMSLTKLVVPNTSVCPGWGNVTITPAAATTTPATGA